VRQQTFTDQTRLARRKGEEKKVIRKTLSSMSGISGLANH